MNSNLDDFCLGDCAKILKKKLKSYNFKVNSYKIYPLDELKGFLGDYCYLLIDYRCENKTENARFFIKVKLTSGFRKDFVDDNCMFSKECMFYEKLVWDISDSGVQIINDCIPQCYFVSNDKYLIFEDLGIQGYVNISARTSPTLDYIKSGLDALVKFHSCGLIYEEKMKEKIGKHFKLPENYPEVFAESFFPRTNLSIRLVEAAKEGTHLIIDLYFKSTEIDIQRLKLLTSEAYDSFFEIIKPSALYRNTICHGDLWNTNIMSKFENGEAVHSYLIDFQTVRYGPPAQDVMSYFYFTTNKTFRQEHMQNLIEYYYRRMGEIFADHGLELAKVLSYKEFVESCNYYEAFACALATNHHHLVTLPSAAMSELMKQGTLQDLIYGGRSNVIQEYWYKDDVYRQKMIENITQFRDILVKNKQL